jgi:hypothetical protein
VSVSKANPQEWAILAYARADKRFVVLAILREEFNYFDIVEEALEIVEQSIIALACHAGALAATAEEAISFISAHNDRCHPAVSRARDQLCLELEIVRKAQHRYAESSPPDLAQTDRLIAAATFTCRLAERVIKHMDER